MKEQGVCPVCNGTGRVSAGESKRKSMIAGYDKDTDTLNCQNCGGQTMYMNPTGKVNLRAADGTPCVHEYVGREAGRCYYHYTCKHCGDTYSIDSSD